MEGLSIRKAVPNDLLTIQTIARHTIDQRYRFFLNESLVNNFINSRRMDDEVEKYLQHCDVMIQNSSIIAFSIYFDDTIHLMMVDSNLHRLGLGEKLLAHTEAALFSNGHRTIRLKTFMTNTQSIAFYKKYNWQEHRAEAYSDFGLTCTIMIKHIQGEG